MNFEILVSADSAHSALQRTANRFALVRSVRELQAEVYTVAVSHGTEKNKIVLALVAFLWVVRILRGVM